MRCKPAESGRWGVSSLEGGRLVHDLDRYLTVNAAFRVVSQGDMAMTTRAVVFIGDVGRREAYFWSGSPDSETVDRR